MKLVSIEQSMLLRLGIVGNPTKQVHLPDVVQAVVEEFQFVQAPQLTGERLESLEFALGKYKDFGIAKLGVYNDGIVIRSQTDTKRLVELMAHLEKWAKKHFGLELHPSREFGDIYESNLIVQTKANIFEVFSKLEKLQKSLAEKLTQASRVSAMYEMVGFSLATTAMKSDGFNPAAFRFERKAGTDSELGYYFSTAPLETAQHMALLSDLEELN